MMVGTLLQPRAKLLLLPFTLVVLPLEYITIDSVSAFGQGNSLLTLSFPLGFHRQLLLCPFLILVSVPDLFWSLFFVPF